MKAIAMRLAYLALGVVALAGCQRPKWDTPTDAFRAFHASLKRGDGKTAWDGLSKESRGRVEARLKQVSTASAGLVSAEDVVAAAFATGLKADPVGEVTVKESGTDSAILLVKVKDRELEQHMVREDGKWRLDLLPLLPET